jgi:hypothetical protein
MNNMYEILDRLTLLERKSTKPDFPDIDKDGNRKEPIAKAAKEVDEARNPQALDYQQGPEDDEEYRRHHGLDDPDRKRERRLRATDHKTLDRLERQAVQRGKQIDEEPNEGNEFSGELAKAKAAGAKQFKVDGKTYPVKGSEMDEARADPHPLDDPLTRFRKKHAPSVMKDPESRKELSKLDTEHSERKKTGYGRGEEEDEDDDGRKKDKPTGEKRGRGRPKGSKRAIGAKGPTGRSKLLTRKESVKENYEEEGPEDLMAAVDEELNAPGKHIDNLVDVLNATFDTMYSPEFERPRAMIQRYIELVTNTDVDHYDDEEDPNHEDEPMIRRMQHGNIARHIREYDLGDYLAAAYHELHKLTGSNKTAGDIKEDYDKDEYDEEGEMAMSQARTIEDAAEELQAILDADENLPEWVQKKITLAKEYIDSARDYLKANRPEGDEMMAEKAVSKAQRRAAGIAHAAKKGDIPKSELRGASKEIAKMSGSELKKFAKTKEKGLPAKKTEEVDETTTAGSVATGAQSTSSKGIFGKGVYEAAFARSLQQVEESLNISTSNSTEGEPTTTVTASGEHASELMNLLAMAGISPDASSCSTCGQKPCGCETVEEDLANSADNTDTMSMDYLLNKISGGLNREKLQVNPNNAGDNPLAMPALGKTAHTLNLGETMQDMQAKTQQRLMDLYQRVK